MRRENKRLIENKNFCDRYPPGQMEGRRDEDKDEIIKILLQIQKITLEKKSWVREIIDELKMHGGELWEKVREVIKEGKGLCSNCGDGEEYTENEVEERRREGEEKQEDQKWRDMEGFIAWNMDHGSHRLQIMELLEDYRYKNIKYGTVSEHRCNYLTKHNFRRDFEDNGWCITMTTYDERIPTEMRDTKNPVEKHGVAIFWRKEVQDNVEVVETGSERIAAIKITEETGYRILLLGIYAPTYGGEKSDEEYAEFLKNLSRVKKKHQGEGRVLIIGDINVGERSMPNRKEMLNEWMRGESII